MVDSSNGERSSAGRALDCDSSGRGFKSLRSPTLPCQAPVAQLDRAVDFESKGRRFESSQACQCTPTSVFSRGFL